MFRKLCRELTGADPSELARSFPLITIVITNVLNQNRVEITLQDFLKDFAVQICAAVASSGTLTCTILE
jgi:hypothetical protein